MTVVTTAVQTANAGEAIIAWGFSQCKGRYSGTYFNTVTGFFCINKIYTVYGKSLFNNNMNIAHFGFAHIDCCHNQHCIAR